MTSLDLSNNQITRIENLDTLVKLTSLELGGNQITRIENLDKLVNLNELNISNNMITSGVEQLLKNKALKVLQIDENPFVQDIGLKLIEDKNHFNDVLSYLLRKSEESQISISLPAKVLFLGNHASGKSTFADYFTLTSDPKKIKNDSEPTHILQIRQLKKETDNHNLPQAVIFDFGGHDYYHGIYQAFMTNDSINCIFWQKDTDNNFLEKIRNKTKKTKVNPDQDKEMTYYFDRKYWLHQLIYFYEKMPDNSSSQPVFLIQTYADKDGRLNTFENYDQLHIENEFYVALTQSACDRSTSLKSSLDYLEASLAEKIISKRKDIEEPKWYIEFIHYILNYNGHESVNLDEIKKQYKRKDNKDFLYNDLEQFSMQGLVLYYPKNDKLKNIAWLNPELTVKHIHEKVLSHSLLKENEGKIKQASFEDICDEHIKELLLIHKVIFFDDKDKENPRYIIPGYLPSVKESNEDYFIFFGFDQPDLILKFENFIPFGFINQMICYYGTAPDKKLYWKDQLVFTYFKGKAKVKIFLDFENLELQISIKSLNTDRDNKEIERNILDDIIALYWDKNPEEIKLGPKKGKALHTDFKDNKNKVENKEIDIYIIDELKPISDLYISVDGKHFINLAFLNDETKDLNEFVYYPLKVETKVIKELVDGKEISKEYKYNIIDRASPKSLSLLPVRHLSTNKNLTGMKKIFISYSKHDEDYLKEFDKHLHNLKKENKIEVYFDKLTDPGEKVHEVIEEKLRDCDYLIVLVSIDSLNTPYINDIEITKAEELSKKIIPIIIKPCDWEYSPLSKYYSTLKGHPLSLNKDLFLNDQIKETTDIERQAWWVEIIKELRTKLFNDKI